MLDIVLKIFDIKPDYDLDIMEKNQTLTTITNKILIQLDEIVKKIKPDIILVHGDTSTVFVSALVAFYNNTPNNTLGIIRYDTKSYTSLFPRKNDHVPHWMQLKKRKQGRTRANYNNAKQGK